MENINKNEQELYIISQIINENVNGRKLALWGDSKELRSILKKSFNLEISCIVTVLPNLVNGGWIRDLNDLRGKSDEYYLIAFGRNYENYYDKLIKEYGYIEIKDFVYRKIKPIMLENWDCSKQEYRDQFGNYISKSNGVIRKVIFRGYNNEVQIYPNVFGLNNTEIDMCANQKLIIREGTQFNADTKFRYMGYNGSSEVYIGCSCRFDETFFRLINHVENSAVVINNNSTFEKKVDIRANSGKQIIIGKDCMFSREIQLQAGDGHTIFDINTSKNINTSYCNEEYKQNQIMIGEHVWVCAKAFILNGTNIGSGCVVGGNSTVKGVFPNNCVIAGNPAKMVKKDIAWSRDGLSESIASCGEKRYRIATNNAKPPISGRNVLVIGGTRFMGIYLVEQLLAYGNKVTIANRGNSKNKFGNRVEQIIFDLEKPETVINALKGKKFDVVFDNLAYCSNYVKEILDNVQCKKYVQLSSVAVYTNRSLDMKEEIFDASCGELCWENVTDNYAHGKIAAERAVEQAFQDIPYIKVRIPFVTKTERLYFFCKHIVNNIPMKIENMDTRFSFVRELEVGRFLPWIVAQDYIGAINFSSFGTVSYRDIIEYIEKKVNRKAIIDTLKGDEVPFSDGTFSLNLDKVEKLGYCTSDLNDWFWTLLDEYIARAVKEKKEEQNNVNSVDRMKCTGCGACYNICPKNAIEMTVDEKGFLTPIVDGDKCISCQLCRKICPSISGEKYLKNNKKCYALMAQDDVREVSSSGGAFTLLAEEVIRRGGVVYGATWTSEYNAEHVMIDKREDISLLRGSKYVQSNTLNTFKEVRGWLEKSRTVLYVGTPCQINGLLSYLQKDYDNLFTVDLLCRGNASNELFKKYVNENYADKKITRINFKEKKPLGWGATTAYEFSDGTIEKTNIHNSVWMYAFLANFMDRDSCYSCEFANNKRVGDISIGDFWGIDKYRKELNDKKGTSIVITSSEKGNKLIMSVRENCKVLVEVPVEKGIPFNSALSTHVRLTDQREYFYQNIKKMPFVAAVDRTVYKEKYQVGIVGWWYNLNYGGTITYYALNKAIQNLGYSVLMIRRSTYGPQMPDDNTVPMRFAKKHYNVSRIYTTRDMHWLNYSCHAFVSGSDQLWNPYLEEYAGPEYFLSFVNEHNLKLSYASSFGNIDSVSDEFRNKYKKLLDRFNGITVREDYAVDICKKDFEIDAKQVCDPIFLCDSNDYKILADSSQKDYGHNYLLNFLLDPNDEKIKAYHYVLEKKGLSGFTNFTDLLESEEKKKIFGEEGVNSNAEIEDFLKAYSNAEFVITDSFHGTCLAIIFNKPFISIANKKRGEKRFVSLLKWLGLMDRLIYDINEIYEKVELLESFDFSNVNNIINDSKKQGYDWLRENLSKMV